MRDSLIKLMPWMGGKGQLMWAIQMLLPIHYKTLVDVFGGSGIITLNTAVPKGCLQIYNDLNHDLYNLLFCVKHRPMALTKELSFLHINACDEFDVLRRQLQGEDFTQLYLDEELQLAEQMFPPPEADEVKRLLQSRAELSDVRRAAAIYKLQRYSYNGNGDSYGVNSCDIQRFFRDIWECSHRLKDVALENKDFESIITAHNDPQTTVYCDPPYYEAERYAVEFPRSDHQRLHDVLAQHRGFAMVSYNNCDYIRRLYEDFFIYEVERPNSQSKKKNDIYREYIMTNYDPRVFCVANDDIRRLQQRWEDMPTGAYPGTTFENLRRIYHEERNDTGQDRPDHPRQRAGGMRYGGRRSVRPDDAQPSAAYAS